MNHGEEPMIIRRATGEDARQIAEILVEDWKTAYRGIIDSAYLDAMSVEERYQRELQRYGQYRVAAVGREILGFTWNELTGDETADCEIIALYVRYARRKCGIGYEKMGGEAYKTGTHPWGDRDYEIISYLYRVDG